MRILGALRPLLFVVTLLSAMLMSCGDMMNMLPGATPVDVDNGDAASCGWVAFDKASSCISTPNTTPRAKLNFRYCDKDGFEAKVVCTAGNGNESDEVIQQFPATAGGVGELDMVLTWSAPIQSTDNITIALYEKEESSINTYSSTPITVKDGSVTSSALATCTLDDEVFFDCGYPEVPTNFSATLKQNPTSQAWEVFLTWDPVAVPSCGAAVSYEVFYSDDSNVLKGSREDVYRNVTLERKGVVYATSGNSYTISSILPKFFRISCTFTETQGTSGVKGIAYSNLSPMCMAGMGISFELDPYSLFLSNTVSNTTDIYCHNDRWKIITKKYSLNSSLQVEQKYLANIDVTLSYSDAPANQRGGITNFSYTNKGTAGDPHKPRFCSASNIPITTARTGANGEISNIKFAIEPAYTFAGDCFVIKAAVQDLVVEADEANWLSVSDDKMVNHALTFLGDPDVSDWYYQQNGSCQLFTDAVAYSYGCKDSKADFNMKMGSYSYYIGDCVYGGNPGQYRPRLTEQQYSVSTSSEFHPSKWAGIDCSGLAQRAANQSNYAIPDIGAGPWIWNSSPVFNAVGTSNFPNYGTPILVGSDALREAVPGDVLIGPGHMVIIRSVSSRRNYLRQTGHFGVIEALGGNVSCVTAGRTWGNVTDYTLYRLRHVNPN